MYTTAHIITQKFVDSAKNESWFVDSGKDDKGAMYVTCDFGNGPAQFFYLEDVEFAYQCSNASEDPTGGM